MDNILAGRLILIVVAALTGLAGMYWRGAVFRSLRAYFTGEAHAIHLAAWRIVLFGSLFVLAAKANSDPRFYNTIPESLWVPLPGWGWLDGPIPQPLAAAAQWGFVAFSLLACIGLFSRTTATLATVMVRSFRPWREIHLMPWVPRWTRGDTRAMTMPTPTVRTATWPNTLP